jgi:hypothetical protein
MTEQCSGDPVRCPNPTGPDLWKLLELFVSMSQSDRRVVELYGVS